MEIGSRNGYASPFQMLGFQTYERPSVPQVRCGVRPSIPSPLTLISEIHLPAKMVAGLTRYYWEGRLKAHHLIRRPYKI
jgi:hypothetical protein